MQPHANPPPSARSPAPYLQPCSNRSCTGQLSLSLTESTTKIEFKAAAAIMSSRHPQTCTSFTRSHRHAGVCCLWMQLCIGSDKHPSLPVSVPDRASCSHKLAAVVNRHSITELNVAISRSWHTQGNTHSCTPQAPRTSCTSMPPACALPQPRVWFHP